MFLIQIIRQKWPRSEILYSHSRSEGEEEDAREERSCCAATNVP